MVKVTQVIAVKSNFYGGKTFFHLLQTFYYYLQVTQYNPVNSMGDHDATHGRPTSRGRKTICTTFLFTVLLFDLIL